MLIHNTVSQVMCIQCNFMMSDVHINSMFGTITEEAIVGWCSRIELYNRLACSCSDKRQNCWENDGTNWCCLHNSAAYYFDISIHLFCYWEFENYYFVRRTFTLDFSIFLLVAMNKLIIIMDSVIGLINCWTCLAQS